MPTAPESVVEESQATSRNETISSESAQIYANLFEKSAEAVFITTPQGLVQFLNPMGEHVTEKPWDEAIGQHIHDLVVLERPGLQAPENSLVTRVRTHGIPVGPETYNLKNNSYIPQSMIETRASPIMDRDGRLTGVLLVFRPMTDHECHEETQPQNNGTITPQHRQEVIGNLTCGVVHDFNNILTAIQGFTELAAMKVSHENSVYDALQQVLTTTHRAKDLIQQILAFGQQGALKPKSIQIQQIIEEVLPLIQVLLSKRIEIQLDLSRGAGFVMADATQIYQILLNLCLNAAHAMKGKNGILRITLEETIIDAKLALMHTNLQPGRYLQLKVSDTGHGIPDDIIPHIFDPFFTTKGAKAGIGLGLSVVHNLVTTWNGYITVDSQVDHGTTFALLFPATNRNEDLTPSGSTQITPACKGHILFIDNEKPLVILGQKMLRYLGYHAITYTSSISALVAFKAAPDKFDAVITNQAMPQLTGDLLIRELRRIRPNLPTILMTSSYYSQSLQEACSIGIGCCLPKPFGCQQLALALQQVLAGHSGENQTVL